MADDTLERATPKPDWNIALWIVLVVFVLFWCAVAIGIGRLTVAAVGLRPLWGICALGMIILLALAGREINGQWLGILIDTRNKMSLSRLQITLWTVMVLSAYLMMAMPRVAAMLGGTLNQQQALDISFPEELILAMGY